MNPAPRDFTAAEILKAWPFFVPVNVALEAAIEAHRAAFARSPGQPLADFALRVVTLARTPTRDDNQRQFDYLHGLPAEAWSRDHDREATLAAISRSIAWSQIN